MATSEVQICNSALVKIGAARINSLDDETKGAKLCKEQYNKLRKKLLRSHPWNFAIRGVALADSGATPVSIFEFTNEFTLPNDVLRVLGTNLLEVQDWVIETNNDNDIVLLCNSSSVTIRYVKNVTDTTFFPPDFEEALALLIAADLAFGYGTFPRKRK